MSSVSAPSGPVLNRRTLQLPLDDKRGTQAMVLTILTEAMLFVMMFTAYFFLSKGNVRWEIEEAPSLTLTLPMLGILMLSSATVDWAEKQAEKYRYLQARIGIAVTIALGVIFLILQQFEYREELKHITPQTDSYGSIFYSITTLHGAHVTLGVLMLTFVLFLPQLERAEKIPHRPFHNVALYWHFVDFVWVVIVSILYITPNIR